MVYDQELGLAIDLAKRAGSAAMKIYKSSDHGKEVKDDGTFVGKADKLANEIIYSGIERVFPLDGIVSEEMDTKRVTTNRSWYIDPIDGTNGFLHRTGEFAVHIGLVEDGIPIMGVVYQPVTQTLYSAAKGAGAFRTTSITEKLQVSSPNENLVLATGYGTKPDANAREALAQDKFGNAKYQTGSEGLRWMHIIEGLADYRIANCNNRIGTWDTAAPHAIMLEAGGFALNTDGTPLLYDGQRKLGKEYVAGVNKQITTEVIGILS